MEVKELLEQTNELNKQILIKLGDRKCKEYEEIQLVKELLRLAQSICKTATRLPIGRPKGIYKLDVCENEIKELIMIGAKQKDIVKKFGCSPITLSIWLKQKYKEWFSSDL